VNYAGKKITETKHKKFDKKTPSSILLKINGGEIMALSALYSCDLQLILSYFYAVIQ
jgi:hypothetical protein